MTEIAAMVENAVIEEMCVPCRSNAVKNGCVSDCPFPPKCAEYHQTVRAARKATHNALQHAYDSSFWNLAGWLRDSLEELRPSREQ